MHLTQVEYNLEQIYTCRLARCLFDLHRSAEADKVIRDFQQKFPEYAAKYACKALIIDIKEAMECGTFCNIIMNNRCNPHMHNSSSYLQRYILGQKNIFSV